MNRVERVRRRDDDAAHRLLDPDAILLDFD
jgi:hypothetical protein